MFSASSGDVRGDDPGLQSVAKKARLHADAPRISQTPRNAQHFEFGLGVEAVAGLDFERGNPFGNQGIRTLQCPCEQVVFGAAAGRVYCRIDTAATSRDFRIGHTA